MTIYIITFLAGAMIGGSAVGCGVGAYFLYREAVLRKVATMLAPHLVNELPRPIQIDTRWGQKRRKRQRPVSLCSADTLEMPRVAVAQIVR